MSGQPAADTNTTGRNLEAAASPGVSLLESPVEDVSFLRGGFREETVRAEQLATKCADPVAVAHPPQETLEDHRRGLDQRAEER